MNEYKINITQRAFSDICECVLFVDNVSNKAAKELYQEIMSSISSLKTFPNAYSCIEGLTIVDTAIRRMPVHKGRYLILYKVEGDLVTICDLLDSRRDSSILKL